MAPEVLRGSAAASSASDVYAFGMTLWELLTRRPLYINMTPTTLEQIVVKGLRPPLPQGVPPFLGTLLMQCWEQEPKLRPTLQQVHRSLQEGVSSLRSTLADGVGQQAFLAQPCCTCSSTKMNGTAVQ